MKIIRGGATVALLLLAGAVVAAGPASAASCGTPAVEAVYETVTHPAVDPTFGPDVKVIDVAAQPAIPGKDAIPAIPAVEEVSHIEKGALITPGVDAVPSMWWNWSPNHEQGPFDGPPSFPVDERGTWQGPHTNGGPDGEGTFNASNGDNGRASWFHREPAVDAVPPVYAPDVKVIDVPAQPAVPEVPAVPAVPAVEEVSHMERGEMLTPGSPETKEQVLASDAVEAGPPCPVKPVVKPIVDRQDPVTPVSVPEAAPVPASLAYTGSGGTGTLALLGGLVLLVGLGAQRLTRKLRVN